MGVVIKLWVMQIWGPAVAGGLLDEYVSGPWDVVVVDEVGLTTCERIVLGQSAKTISNRHCAPLPRIVMRVQKKYRKPGWWKYNDCVSQYAVNLFFLEPLRSVRICDIVDNMSDFELWKHAIQK